MDLLRYTAYLMTAIGSITVGAGWILDLDQVYMLVGVLLAWAGIVKIAVVAIWTKVAMIGTDDHRPIAGE